MISSYTPVNSSVNVNLPLGSDDGLDRPRQSCQIRIRSLEEKLGKIEDGSSIRASCAPRLNHAKRFLRSDEFGGCNYELRIVELLMSEA